MPSPSSFTELHHAIEGIAVRRLELYEPDELQPLVAPNSIAIIGASENPGFGRLALSSVVQSAPVAGAVWAVNPRFTEVLGVPCVASVADLPTKVDLAVIGVQGGRVPGILEESAKAGIRAALIHSSGFGELGTQRGDALRDEINGSRSIKLYACVWTEQSRAVELHEGSVSGRPHHR